MSYFHVTTARNLRGIRRDRMIDPSKSRGKREVSWFVPEGKVEWAICHVQIRHAAKLSEIVILECAMTHAEVSEHAGSGKFFRASVTYWAQVSKVYTAGEWVSKKELDTAGITAGLVAG